MIAVFGGLHAIFGSKLAVVDGLGSIVRSFSAAQRGLGAFVCRMLTVACGAISCRTVQVPCRVVARFGLLVTQPGRFVTALRSEAGLPAADSTQLIGAGILAVLGRLRAIFGCNPAVVDGLGAVVRGAGTSRSRLSTFVGRALPVAGRSIARRSIQVTGRVVARFCLPIAQPGGDVAAQRSEAGLPTADSTQLVGAGILAILGGLGTILGCNSAVVDGLGAVVGSAGPTPRRRQRSFAHSTLAMPGRAISRCAVEITGRIIARFGLSVTLFSLPVTDVRGQVAIPSFNVALACGREGVLTWIRAFAVLIGACHAAVHP